VGASILMYHKIAVPGVGAKIRSHYVHPVAFDRQLRLLKAMGYQSVNPGEATEKSARDIAITFDDGYENFLTKALPSLTNNGFGATVFVVTDLLGQTDKWDDGAEPLMTLAQVTECANAGIEIGSHTSTHADLTAVAPSVANEEILQSKELLVAAGITNPGFCYPYGRHNEAVRKMVKSAGYPYACGTQRGENGINTDIFDLHRINIRSDTSLPIFLFKLLRARRGR